MKKKNCGFWFGYVVGYRKLLEVVLAWENFLFFGSSISISRSRFPISRSPIPLSRSLIPLSGFLFLFLGLSFLFPIRGVPYQMIRFILVARICCEVMCGNLSSGRMSCIIFRFVIVDVICSVFIQYNIFWTLNYLPPGSLWLAKSLNSDHLSFSASLCHLYLCASLCLFCLVIISFGSCPFERKTRVE